MWCKSEPITQSHLNWSVFFTALLSSNPYFVHCIINYIFTQHWKKKLKLRNQELIPQRNWVFDTNSDFIITLSLEPNVADLRYFKIWILLNQIIWIWNIKGLKSRVLKILRFKYLILFKRLNSFVTKLVTMDICAFSYKSVDLC